MIQFHDTLLKFERFRPPTLHFAHFRNEVVHPFHELLHLVIGIRSLFTSEQCQALDDKAEMFVQELAIGSRQFAWDLIARLDLGQPEFPVLLIRVFMFLGAGDLEGHEQKKEDRKSRQQCDEASVSGR